MDMKKIMMIVESRLSGPDITYHEKSDRITAEVSANLSGKFTRLVQNLQKIDSLTTELKELQADVKQQRREDVAALFDAEDAVLTRVVDTKSAILTLSKDPADRVTPKYKDILEEFEKHLTPELLKVLEVLKATHVTVTQVEPSLRWKLKESVDEEKIDRVVNLVNGWLTKYDRKLNQLVS